MIFKNAFVIDPANQLEGLYDVRIFNGKIDAIETCGSFDADFAKDSTLMGWDLQGKWFIPGLIDLHVHLREPGLEYKETIESGTQAAVQGGFTTVACMANTLPVNDSPSVTRYIVEQAKKHAHCRVYPIGAVTKGLKGESLSEMGLMSEEGIIAISDDGMPVMNSSLMRKAMQYARSFNLPVISHAEDLNLSAGAPMSEGVVSNLLGFRGNPSVSEEIMVSREIALAKDTGAKVHIAHLSTESALEQIRYAKLRGVPVTAEVTPHHLMLNENSVLKCGHFGAHYHARTDYKMAPPLRTKKDQDALWEGLRTGVIDCVASDHAPHGCVDKETEFEMAANGILGLQTTLPLMLEAFHQGKISRLRLIEVLSSAPAKILGLPFGNLSVGRPADFCIVDPTVEWELTAAQIVSKSQNSPFLGRKFQGRVVATFVDGVLKYDGRN